MLELHGAPLWRSTEERPAWSAMALARATPRRMPRARLAVMIVALLPGAACGDGSSSSASGASPGQDGAGAGDAGSDARENGVARADVRIAVAQSDDRAAARLCAARDLESVSGAPG
jgi:hypothetical protein